MNKTKTMRIGKYISNKTSKYATVKFQEVAKFKYLGVVIVYAAKRAKGAVDYIIRTSLYKKFLLNSLTFAENYVTYQRRIMDF